MSWRSAEAAAKPDTDIGLGLQQDLQQLVDWPWLQVTQNPQALNSASCVRPLALGRGLAANNQQCQAEDPQQGP